MMALDENEITDPAEDAAEDLSRQNSIRVLPGASETAASFEFLHEDHTLGNALRYMIMKKSSSLAAYVEYYINSNFGADSPDVELCGYSIPHPSEAKMNLRIQTFENTTVYDALEKGLEDLMQVCDVVVEKFMIERDSFRESS